MKTILPTQASPGRVADCRLPIETGKIGRQVFQIARGKFKIIHGFTLIELLVVISIIGLLAAFLFSVSGAVKRKEYLSSATAEMGKIEAAIANYHAAYGFYPPSGTNVLTNPLYYELMGTTITNTTPPGFQLLDGSSSIEQPTVQNTFGVSGFVNCNKSGTNNEDSTPAKTFFTDIRPNQISFITNSATQKPFYFLVYSRGGPDAQYDPIGNYENASVAPGVNPWRYVYPGTNNPNSYDLYVQLVIGPGKTNLVCNWSKQVQLNSPLP